MNKEAGPFGKAVVKARKARGISQRHLARIMKRDQKHLSQIENGNGDPQLSTVILIARALQMSPGDLVNDANAEIPPLPEEPFDFTPPKGRGRPKKQGS